MSEFPQWLQRLIEIPDVKDILISGCNCWIDRGNGLEKIEPGLPSEPQLETELRELAFSLGGRLDIASPVVDISHKNLRFHILLPHGIALNPQLSIRIHPKNQLSLSDLVQSNLLTQEQAGFLMRQVAAAKTIVISGPTSSGKTTLLRALLAELEERIIAIEQIPELNLAAPVISLFARPGNQDGLGEITLSELVNHSLRMRPDRLVVGEVRREEFAAFLQAVTNGHPGSMTTVHSSSLRDVPRRLITLGLISGYSKELTQELVLGAVDLVLQLERSGSNRKLVAIGELSVSGHGLEIQEI